MGNGTSRRRLIFVLGFGAMAGCTSTPLLQPDLAAPPAILVPAGAAGVVDSRARFREILCAVTPSDSVRDCEAMLHRLGGEAPPSGRPVGEDRRAFHCGSRSSPGTAPIVLRAWSASSVTLARI
jgi:hypothetical protein